MRLFLFIISTVITLALIFTLNTKLGQIPPLGRFLSPQQGFWQNAEPVDIGRDEQLTIKGLKGKVNVYLDDRLVPHVFANNEEDVYFVQGFLHAKYRLWQMEFQTRAAAGRVSEVIGNDPRAIRYDREQRRLGMVYAAENTLKAIDSDQQSKDYYDAYSNGVNAYIQTLSESQLPVEYKLLDYRPEPWSNLKTALFLKMMSKDLAGYERDLEFTNERTVFSLEEMNMLYPQISDSSIPIVPKGTLFAAPGVDPIPPSTADSLYFGKDTSINDQEINKSNRMNGSNNWAVSGKKTKSGVPILCNDPHLSLTLPSIWFEMQLTTPTMNVYGATFPGSPSVIIGFNDNIAFGFTNAQRDVKDYYRIRFKDASKKEYWFNGKWQPSSLREEHIKIRDGETVYDTVAYTVFGPVMYDQSFSHDSTSDNTAIAVRWSAHDPSNEGAMWFKLNRARNYDDYFNAIKDYSCPGQNMIFASRSGDIALWQQAKFPAQWKGQGLYVMPGEDSSYMWQGYIPQQENPHVINPESGFIESANQRPVDSSYHYFIPGNYIIPRGITLSHRLQEMENITPQDMMKLQNDYYSTTAAAAVPLFLKNMNASSLSAKERAYLNEIRHWNYCAAPDSKATTIYQAWFDSLKNVVWDDEFSRIKGPKVFPDEQTLLEALLRDSSFKFIDDINTTEKETLNEQVTKAFRLAAKGLVEEEKKNALVWWKHKNSSVLHILSTILPFARQGLQVGGWNNTINAITQTHGPSWRMIVQLSSPTEAYGVYPGGQSGNPGSKYYDNFIDSWVNGKYYTLWLMKENEVADKRIIGKISFNKA